MPSPSVKIPEQSDKALRRRRVLGVVAAAALLVGLPLPWLFGGTGLQYGFAAGTAWPSRIAPILVLAAGLATAAHVLRRDDGRWALLLGLSAVGAVFGLLDRFADPSLGAGLGLALVGLALLAYVVLRTFFEYLDTVGVAGIGLMIFAFQLVGPRTWLWLLVGAGAVAVGVWIAIRPSGG